VGRGRARVICVCMCVYVDGGGLCSYVTGSKTNLHGALAVTEDLELRQGDLVADPDAVRALVPLVPDVPHRVSD